MKVKIIFPVFLLILILSFFQAYFLKGTIENELRFDLISQGELAADSISKFSQKAILDNDVYMIKGFIDESLKMKGVEYVYIKDESGEIIFHTFIPDIPELFLNIKKEKMSQKIKQRGLKLDGLRIIELEKPILSGILGAVFVGMAIEKEEKATIYPILKNFITLTIALTALSLIFLFFYLSGIIRPLLNLKNLINKVLDKKDTNVELKNNLNDEIGELIDAFGHMLKWVNTYTEGLKRHLNIAALISETDASGKIIDVNDKFCELSQYSRDELIGRTHRVVSSGFHSTDFWRDAWKVLSLGRTFKTEVCNKSKGGELYWVEATMFPLLNNKGDIEGYVAVSIDITDKKNKESQYYHETKLAHIGEIAAGVGHEINNPLAVAIGSVRFIQKTLHKNEVERVEKKLSKVANALERIRKIVDGLRTFSRSTNSKMEMIDLRDVVEGTIDLIQEIYRKDGVDITFDNKKVDFFIEGNYGKLQQIVMNFISNARDATSGQKIRKIDIAMKEVNGKSVTISVKDNGCGMSNLIKEKSLEPFFTTKGEGVGTGIGLGLVVNFVEEMHGEILIDTELGHGSTFSVTFPLKINEVKVKVKEEKRKKKERRMLVGKALVVDDEVDVREVIRDILEFAGLEVEEADGGDTALEKVRLERYDYIFTDMKMPNMRGDKFIEESRKLPNGDTVYFIVTGGVLLSKTEEEKLNKLSDGYITKPFTDETIYEALEKFQIKNS